MSHEIMRVSAKGQLTIPVRIREKLNIREGDYVQISIEEGEARIKKISSVIPLSKEDPMWEMVGMGKSDYRDVSLNHDLYLAEDEVNRWK
ncbi:MAG: AbrB/MazE/SpoVT family DNA-binding domain-containing protein [Desulfitobacterium hafniense]|nr:AbrB/MazE/SpoVT family DNA-binding domain-containing protein [Clostridium sp.]MDA8228894.1 AbrB/MazE/SpoVT family DNA-binding domain-containing protein [Desulfitobacterium hafniense]